MKKKNITDGNPLSNEVKINLNMLSPLMLDWIGRHVNSIDVVTINQHSMARWGMKLKKKLAQPSDLGNCIGHGAVLGFYTGAGDCILTFGGPRHQIISQKDYNQMWTCGCQVSQHSQHQSRPPVLAVKTAGR